MYESKAKTTKISATSRSAIKIRESYYTVEYTEERSIPDCTPFVITECARRTNK